MERFGGSPPFAMLADPRETLDRGKLRPAYLLFGSLKSDAV